LTFRDLFLQFPTFFSSTKVEQDYGGAIKIVDFIVAKYDREKNVARRVADFASPENCWYCNNCCEAYGWFSWVSILLKIKWFHTNERRRTS
jgi:hypothetical protein